MRIGKLSVIDLQNGCISIQYGERYVMLNDVGKHVEQVPPSIVLTRDDLQDLRVLLDMLDVAELPRPNIQNVAEGIIQGAQSLARDIRRRTQFQTLVDVSLEGGAFYEIAAYAERAYGSRVQSHNMTIRIGHDVELSRMYGGRRHGY